MAGNKVNLTYIDNDAERKAYFEKIKEGLINEMTEISTLCGSEACAVIYSPFEELPVVWPSQEVAERVIQRFNDLPDEDKTRNMVNSESFIQHEIKKAKERIHRLQMENRRKELTIFMFNVLDGKASMEDFDPKDSREMNEIIDEILEEINSRMKTVEMAGTDGGTQSVMSPGAGHDGDGEGTSEDSPPTTPTPIRFN